MILTEQIASLKAKLAASLMGGPGLTKRIAALRARIAELEAQSASE